MIIPEEETLVAIFIYLLYKQSQLREIRKKKEVVEKLKRK